jgi:hypothetical protein
MPSTCPNCGAPRGETSNFCRVCGLDYWNAAQEEQAVQPATPVEPAQAMPRSGTNTAGFLVGAIVAAALIGGAIMFLQGTADDVTREVAVEPDDDPTHEPTPTARRTPAPTPHPGERAFKEFVKHITPTSAVIVAGMENVAADATRVDVEALQNSSINLWLVLGEEVQWIEDNPPRRCYQDLHSAYTDAITTLHDALDVISDGAIHSDPDLLNEGSETMSTGNRLIDDATKLIGPANRACRS